VLVSDLHRHAVALAHGVRRLGGEVLTEAVFTHVSTAWGDDGTTRVVEEALIADGDAWLTGSTWRGRRVLRIAVSNWATDEAQVQRTLAALERAAASVRTAAPPG
jgi:hypothetical protein